MITITTSRAAHALIGARTGTGYRLGDTVEVRLLEAIPSAGALRFEMLTEPTRGNFASLKSGGRPRDQRQRKFGKFQQRRR